MDGKCGKFIVRQHDLEASVFDKMRDVVGIEPCQAEATHSRCSGRSHAVDDVSRREVN